MTNNKFVLTEKAKSFGPNTFFYIAFSGNSEPVDLTHLGWYQNALEHYKQQLISTEKISERLAAKVALHEVQKMSPFDLLLSAKHGELWPITLGYVESENDKDLTNSEALNPFINNTNRISCTSGFLAIGANNMLDNDTDFNQFGQVELIDAVTSLAQWIDDVGVWLCEKDLLSCVFAYDIAEPFGERVARAILDENTVNVAIKKEAIMCDILTALGGNNVGEEWRECPLLVDYLAAQEDTPDANVRENVSFPVWPDKQELDLAAKASGLSVDTIMAAHNAMLNVIHGRKQ